MCRRVRQYPQYPPIPTNTLKEMQPIPRATKHHNACKTLGWRTPARSGSSPLVAVVAPRPCDPASHGVRPLQRAAPRTALAKTATHHKTPEQRFKILRRFFEGANNWVGFPGRRPLRGGGGRGAPPVQSSIARRVCVCVGHTSWARQQKAHPVLCNWAVFRSSKKCREQNRVLVCVALRGGAASRGDHPLENWRATTQGMAALLPAERTGDHPRNGNAASGNTGGEREEPT